MRLVLALTALLATPAMAQMTDAEREGFRAEVRAYLLENPEVIVEAMTELQARQDADIANRETALLAANMDAIVNDGHSWVGGNPQGDITVVEFMDYRCSYCRKAMEEVAELVTTDGNIRFIIKEYPILGEESLLSAQFAIAVLQMHSADTYQQVHEALLTMRGTATLEALGNLAADLGLDPAPILAQMNSPDVRAVIDANHALGQTMEINGTPTFVIGDAMVRGYVPLDGMMQIVADERTN